MRAPAPPCPAGPACASGQRVRAVVEGRADERRPNGIELAHRPLPRVLFRDDRALLDRPEHAAEAEDDVRAVPAVPLFDRLGPRAPLRSRARASPRRTSGVTGSTSSLGGGQHPRPRALGTPSGRKRCCSGRPRRAPASRGRGRAASSAWGPGGGGVPGRRTTLRGASTSARAARRGGGEARQAPGDHPRRGLLRHDEEIRVAPLVRVADGERSVQVNTDQIRPEHSAHAGDESDRTPSSSGTASTSAIDCRE